MAQQVLHPRLPPDGELPEHGVATEAARLVREHGAICIAGYGGAEDGFSTVEYDKLRIAAGSAADVYFKAPQFEQDETVVVGFEKNSLSLRASGDDSVYIYIYAPALGSGILSAPVARKGRQLRMRLPETWAGHDVHIYGFVVDKEGRASNSTYIGPGRVNHNEERGRYMPIDGNWQEFVTLAQGSSSSPTPTAEKTANEGAETVQNDAEPPGIP